MAHRVRYRFAPAPGASRSGAARGDRRNARLHGTGTDRANEPLRRLAQRSLRAGRDLLRDVDGDVAVHGRGPDGVGPLPHRPATGPAGGAGRGHPRPPLRDRDEAPRQARRGSLPDSRWSRDRPPALSSGLGGDRPHRALPAGHRGRVGSPGHPGAAIRARARDRHAGRGLRPRRRSGHPRPGAGLRVLRHRQILGSQRAIQSARPTARPLRGREVRPVCEGCPVRHFGLAELVTRPEVGSLLLVGAYRNNEVSPSHPLMQALGAIREAGAPVHDIVLAPLSLEEVGRLVADALHCTAERAEPLARLVHQKTGGNPFFAIQFLMMLGDELLLTYDAHAGDWTWDVHRIRAKGYTDNVVDLMVGRLNRLSDPTREALKELACLGNAVEIATLEVLHGHSEQAAHSGLWEAVRAGLVFQQDGSYKFLHDRIQQAAYSLIPEEHRAATHLRVGRALRAGMTADDLAEHVFEIVSQLNRGAVLIT